MRLILFFVIAVMVLVVSVSAQTSFSLWPYYVEVSVERNETGLYDFVVPLQVMDKSRPDLADLRLFDSGNREIPYAIRIRRDVDEKREIPTRFFNNVLGSATTEVSVDLGENPGEHNEIEIQTGGSNFRRHVEVEGSDSGREWKLLNGDAVVFSFAAQNSVAESPRVTYPTSRYRYLRVKVSRDELTDDETPQINAVKVKMAVREKGWLSSWEIYVPPYQLLRNQGAHASAWNLDLGARVPCERLKLQISDDSFSRPFQVEAIDDPQNPRVIAMGDLTRHAGDAIQPLEIVFNQEENVQKLRLQITDYSNPTLNIESAEAAAPGRQLFFELKELPAQPLRLYFGNANVTAPHYDYEKELRADFSKSPINGSLGSVLPNREYKPEPLPLTERVPWLIYVVLAVSSIALAFVLLSLARTATHLGRKEPQKS